MASDSVRTGSTFVAGATITFTCGLPQGGPASVTYKWYFGTMEITSATSSTYQIPQPAAPTDVGMYRCDVTDGATLPISSNYTFAGSKNASLSLTIQSKILVSLKIITLLTNHSISSLHLRPKTIGNCLALSAIFDN